MDSEKLRMAPPETAEQLAQRLERESRASNLKRESSLEQSLAPYRVGSVRYLNAVPLTRGLEDEIIFATPSKLAQMLQRDELDAALVSVTEVLFTNRYDVLDGIAIASLGEVKSVILAHRKPLAEVKEVYCDTASLTSVQLLKVLLAERGLHPEFRDLQSYDHATLPDYALLIGDPALDFLRGSQEGAATAPSPRSATHQIWDLGAAWYDMTGLPFVYAVWALRRGIDTLDLRRHLRDARDFGMDTLDHIIRTRPEYDYEFRKDYLGWHIHYHLGTDEKRGLAKFIELLRQNTTQLIFEPKFLT